MSETKSKSITDLSWDQKVKIKNHIKNKSDNSIECTISDLRIMNSYARVTFNPKFTKSDNITIDLNLDSSTNLDDKKTEFATFLKNHGILPCENNLTSKLIGKETELVFQINSNSVDIINPYKKDTRHNKDKNSNILDYIKTNLVAYLIAFFVFVGSLFSLYSFELIILDSLYIGTIAFMFGYLTIALVSYSSIFDSNID